MALTLWRSRPVSVTEHPMAAITTTRLLPSLSGECLPTREPLASFARQGVRGLTLEEPVILSSLTSEATISFAEFLRNAAGAGLRVHWTGDAAGFEHQLWHLDPPRLANGDFQWPVSAAPAFCIRFGPGFARVRSARSGEPPKELILHSLDAALLHSHLTPQAISYEASREATSQHGLLRQGLLICVGSYALTSPIRQTFGKPVRSEK